MRPQTNHLQSLVNVYCSSNMNFSQGRNLLSLSGQFLCESLLTDGTKPPCCADSPYISCQSYMDHQNILFHKGLLPYHCGQLVNLSVLLNVR